jgi:hypothetical protein
MRTCIANCVQKLDTEWHFNAAVQPPPPLDFNDLFRLLIGTVDVPLSQETAALIGDDDRVLIGRHSSKIALYRDAEWCDILQQMASVVERDEETLAICEQICISVEGYSTQMLRQERQALKAAETHQQVEAAVTLAKHRESTDIKNARMDYLMHDLLQLSMSQS